MAAGEGLSAGGGPHLLDVISVKRVHNGRDVIVGEVIPSVEVDLAEHAGDVVSTVLDGVEVANVGHRELDLDLLSSLDGDGSNLSHTGVASEVDGASGLVQRPEGHGVGTGNGSGGSEDESLSEMHFDFFCVCKGMFLRKCCAFGGILDEGLNVK